MNILPSLNSALYNIFIWRHVGWRVYYRFDEIIRADKEAFEQADKGARTMPRRVVGNAEPRDRVTHRKQLRTEDARFDDVIQVCFETSDEVWLGVKKICPEILELQEFVTRIMKQAAPKLDDSKPVSKPPSYSLDGLRTKIRCFKTERTLWARYVWWAAVSGRDLKELLSGVLFAYVSKNSSKDRRDR